MYDELINDIEQDFEEDIDFEAQRRRMEQIEAEIEKARLAKKKPIMPLPEQSDKNNKKKGKKKKKKRVNGNDKIEIKAQKGLKLTPGYHPTLEDIRRENQPKPVLYLCVY